MHPLLAPEYLSRLICSITAGGGAPSGGGGGGSGAPGGDDGGDGGDGGNPPPPPKPMTPDQVNRAIKDHTARITKAFDTRLTELTEQNQALSASIEKLLQGGAGTGAAGDGAGAGALPPEIKKQLDDMSAKLEKATKLAADEKAARETTTASGRAKEERTALKDALLERGVSPIQAPVLAAYLHGEGKAIARDADDTIVFKKGDDLLDLGEGLDEFLRTDAGKAWLPPKQSQGSGATGTGNARGRRAQGPVSIEEVGEFLEKHITR